MTIAGLSFLIKMELDMEKTKPMTDLERIQQSYSSGSQKYVPVDSQVETSKRSDSTKEPTRDSKPQRSLRVTT